MLTVPLSVKSIIRDWKSGELTLLALALIIAVACVSSINIFSSLVKQQIEQKASSLLGADRMVVSPIPIDSDWIAFAEQSGLQHTMTLDFFSMVEAHDNLKLVKVKAVQANYPLRGEVKVAQQLFAKPQVITQLVKPGEVWAVVRVFSMLNVKIGDYLQVGEASLKVSKVLVEEPGQSGDWFNIAPKIMISWQDIQKTQVVRPGSRLIYHWLLSGDGKALKKMDSFLKQKISEQQKIISSESSDSSVSKTVQRTLDYLSLGTLMSLILACVAVSMASFRYAERHVKQVALMRCFGARQNKIVALHVGSLVLLGMIASIIGVFLGYLVQPLLLTWLGGLLPSMQVTYPISPAILSSLSCLLILLFFSLANILSLRQVTAINILRAKTLTSNHVFWTYLCAFILLGIVAYFYTQSWRVSVSVVSCCVLFVALVFGLVMLPNLSLFKSKRRLNLNWRFGVNNIARSPINSSLQVIGIGLALTALLSLYLMRTGLLNAWQQQIPPGSANYFVINIEPAQVKPLSRSLVNNGIQSSQIYPMVRGRLIGINGQSMTARLGERVKSINALQRELNLSWSENLPAENKVIKGQWQVKDANLDWVSVEKGVAKQVGIKLGDVLEFRIASKVVKATVTSIRQVNWVSFQPNFFMLFKPGLLNDLPQTYITSLYISAQNQSVLNELVALYPNVTIIDVANIINKIRNIVDNSAKVIDFMMIFGLLAGFIILILAMLSFSTAKQQEVFVLKSLGMKRRQLLLIQSSESIIIGGIAGLLAVVIAFVLNFYIAYEILNIQFIAPLHWLLVIPLSSSGMTATINTLVMRSQYQT